MTAISNILGTEGVIRRNPSVRLLANRMFRAFFIGNLTNASGMELRMMAQSWLILELGGSQFMVGTALGARFVPGVIIGLMAGVWVDKFGGRFMLLWERILLLWLAVITALLVISDTVVVWHVIVLSLVSSAALSLGGPAMNTMVTSLVPKSSLQVANSINQLTFSSARALGPMGAGLLIAAFGMGSPWLALIGLYIISIAATWSLPKAEAESDATGGESMLTSIKSGLKYVKATPAIGQLMLLASSVIFAGGMLAIIPVYAKNRFDVGGSGLGIMMAATALGHATGALLIASTGGFKRKSVSMMLAVALYSIAATGFGYSTNYPVSLVFLFLSGVAIPIWVTTVVTLLQTESDPNMLGRVMALFALTVQFVALGAMVFAWVGLQIGNEAMLLYTSIGFFGLHAILMIFSPTIRRL